MYQCTLRFHLDMGADIRFLPLILQLSEYAYVQCLDSEVQGLH